MFFFYKLLFENGLFVKQIGRHNIFKGYKMTNLQCTALSTCRTPPPHAAEPPYSLLIINQGCGQAHYLSQSRPRPPCQRQPPWQPYSECSDSRSYGYIQLRIG